MINPNNDVFHISEEGFDAKTAEIKNLIIDSRYTHPKIVLGNDPSHFSFDEYTFGSEPGNNSTTTLFTIPHGYDYIPMAIVQMVMSGGTIVNLPFIQFQSIFVPPSTFGFYEERFFYYTDETNLYIKFKRTLTAGSRPGGTNKNGTTYGFKRQIFAENGLE